MLMKNFAALVASTPLLLAHPHGNHGDNKNPRLHQKEAKQLRAAEKKTDHMIEDLSELDDKLYAFFHAQAFERKVAELTPDQQQLFETLIKAGRKPWTQIQKQYQRLSRTLDQFDAGLNDIADLLGDEFKEMFEVQDDPCGDNPCQNGGQCFDAHHIEDWQLAYPDALYICECPENWEGKNCEINVNFCEPDQCVNGLCINGSDSFTCQCFAGWDGPLCDINIDDCAFNPCANGACVDGIDSFTCDCDAGWEGDLCDFNIDDCAPNPCINGACVDGIDSFTCDCDAGWEGDLCDVNIDDCVGHNGCGSNGACVDDIDGYYCACNAGWEGEFCDVVTPLFLGTYKSPGHPYAYADNQVHETPVQFPSDSDQVFTGFVIEIVDFQLEDHTDYCYDYFSIEPLSTVDGAAISTLASNYDSNGNSYNIYNTNICGEIGVVTRNGLPTFQVNDQVTLSNLKSFNINFVSDHSNVERGWNINVYAIPATCAADPCQHGSACVPTTDASLYQCECAAGYEGRNCDVDTDDCLSNWCMNGSCVDGLNSYTCNCDAGWEGQFCDVNIDDCASNPCVNGSCNDGIESFTCSCDAGWEGDLCDVNIDECAFSICPSTSTCVDLIDDYECLCNDGYEGSDCDQISPAFRTEYTSPNYPEPHSNYENDATFLGLQDPNNSGFAIELVDFQLEDNDDGTCYDYFSINPISTVDGSDTSALAASISGFYDTPICGEIGVHSQNSLPTFQVGDVITLPNLEAFDIKFVSDLSNSERGWKINVYELPPLIDFSFNGESFKAYQESEWLGISELSYANNVNHEQTFTLYDWQLAAGADGFQLKFNDFEIEDYVYFANGPSVYCFDYIKFVPLETIDGSDVSTITTAYYANGGNDVNNFWNADNCGEFGETLGFPVVQGSFYRLANVKSFKVIFATDASTNQRGYDFDLYWHIN